MGFANAELRETAGDGGLTTFEAVGFGVGVGTLALHTLTGGLAVSGATAPTATELKMTDTILNLAYLVGAAAILSIICGEVLMTIRNKK